MSQIATALAKAKEHPGTQAPFMIGANAKRTPTAVAAKKRFSANVVWTIVLACSVCTAGIVIWMTNRGAEAVTTALALEVPHAEPASSPTAAAVVVAGNPSPAGNALVRLNRNESAVRRLSISAVLPGEQPRIMANGKVYHVGDIVLPPEISFAGTDNGQLVFTDTAGNRFTRRF